MGLGFLGCVTVQSRVASNRVVQGKKSSSEVVEKQAGKDGGMDCGAMACSMPFLCNIGGHTLSD